MFVRGVAILILLVFGVANAQVGLNVDVESAVRTEFADAPVMIEIARCESKFRQYADSGNPFYGGYGGRMAGIFQIYSDIHRTYAAGLGMDIDTTAGNIAYARHLYDREGTKPWNSSISCWGAAQPSTPASTETTSAVSGELTMDLSTGMDHPQVRILQQKLNAAGFTITESGPGSPDNETTLYGALTRAAVQKLQCAKGVVCGGDGFSTGYGVFGPRTRAALLGSATAVAEGPPLLPSPSSQSQTTTSASNTASTPTSYSDADKQKIAELEAQIVALKAQLAALMANAH